MKKLIIMVGFPGSGKTTHAKKHYPKFERISQDDLGGKRGRFFAALEAALRLGKNIVADRCNHTVRHRETILSMAKRHGYEIEIVWVATPHKMAIERLTNRVDHPTIGFDMEDEKKMKIYNMFRSEFEPPSMTENIEALEISGLVNECPECGHYMIADETMDICDTCYEKGLAELYEAHDKSVLKDEPDQKFIDNLIYAVYSRIVRESK